MSFLSSIVSGIFGLEGADAAADASVEAAQIASDTQIDMFNRGVGLTLPQMTAGYNALNQQNALLGLPQIDYQPALDQFTNGGQGSAAYGASYSPGAAYVNAHPDLQAAWNGNSHNVQGQFDSIDDWGDWHYTTFGRNEGRTAPQAAFSELQAAQPAGPTGGNALSIEDAQNNAYSDFENSGFYRSMIPVTEQGMGRLVDAYGAGGSLISGSAQKALTDYMKGNESTAFNNYYGALGGMSGMGASLTSQTSGQSQQLGNALANNQLRMGDARATSYAQRGQIMGDIAGQGVDAGMQFLGGFF